MGRMGRIVMACSATVDIDVRESSGKRHDAWTHVSLYLADPRPAQSYATLSPRHALDVPYQGLEAACVQRVLGRPPRPCRPLPKTRPTSTWWVLRRGLGLRCRCARGQWSLFCRLFEFWCCCLRVALMASWASWPSQCLSLPVSQSPSLPVCQSFIFPDSQFSLFGTIAVWRKGAQGDGTARWRRRLYSTNGGETTDPCLQLFRAHLRTAEHTPSRARSRAHTS